jgi:CarD family transcriptional regulator
VAKQAAPKPTAVHEVPKSNEAPAADVTKAKRVAAKPVDAVKESKPPVAVQELGASSVLGKARADGQMPSAVAESAAPSVGAKEEAVGPRPAPKAAKRAARKPVSAKSESAAPEDKPMTRAPESGEEAQAKQEEASFPEAAPVEPAAVAEAMVAVFEPVIAVFEAVLAEPEPAVAEPETVAAEPEPAAAESEPVVAEPEPVAAEPELVAAEPEPAAAEPEPVAAEPEPAAPVAPAHRHHIPMNRANPPPRPMAKAEVFVEGDHVVYPTHGVGKVERIAVEEIAGHKLELIHITFEENRMTLRVPVAKARSAGLRKLATRKLFDEALAVLKGRARIKRTMWSRRAQEYEAKINSGDPLSIAEVVRDLHRNAGQPDQSFSERQIYEAAMDRLAAELAALDKTDKLTAATKLSDFLKTV